MRWHVLPHSIPVEALAAPFCACAAKARTDDSEAQHDGGIFTNMKRRRLGIAGALLAAFVVVVTACSSDKSSSTGGYVFVEEGADQSQATLTAIALAKTPATPSPTLTPTEAGTPYVIPTNTPDEDPDLVITRVGNTDVTLAEYQRRVRFDRYRLLYQIVKLVEKYGPGQILDLTRSDNNYVSGLFATLADSYSFGAQSQRLIVIDRIIEQEALRRGVEVSPEQFDAKLGEYLGLTVGEGGKLPPEADQRYQEFLQGLKTYANMSEEEFRRIVRARTLYSQLQLIISHEPGVIPQDKKARVGRDMQDIIVKTREEADTVVTRLQAGEAMSAISASMGYTPASGSSASRVLRWSDTGVTDEVLNAVFGADEGAIVGPFEVGTGWYVGVVGQEVFDVLSPQDIDALRKEYFLNWIESRMDDPEYVQDFDNWIDFTPQEPLPQDVSPLLRTENFILPDTTGTPSPFDSLFGPLTETG